MALCFQMKVVEAVEVWFWTLALLDFQGAVAEPCLWQKAEGGIFIVGRAQKSILGFRV